MSLATLPAWWWMSRLDWRRVALMAGVVFLTANLASAVVTQYETLLAARFIASLAGGTLMICASAARPERRTRRGSTPSGCSGNCC